MDVVDADVDVADVDVVVWAAFVVGTAVVAAKPLAVVVDAVLHNSVLCPGPRYATHLHHLCVV